MFITRGGEGCVIFGIEGILGGSEGVKDGKGKDEDKGKGEVSIDQLLPTIIFEIGKITGFKCNPKFIKKVGSLALTPDQS